MRADNNGQCPDGFYHRSSYCYVNPSARWLRGMDVALCLSLIGLMVAIILSFVA